MGGVSLAVPLIGHDRQLDRARRWVADLAEGRGRAALVEGEPGIGKSSLLRAIARDARDAGTQVFWASCDELSHTFPLLPLLEAVGPEAGDGLTGIAGTLRAESTPGNMTDVVAAATERFLAFMDELCAVRPVLLMVDDLQWADPATVIALGRLARAVRQLPLLVVAATRPVPRRADLIALRRTIAPDA